MSSNLQEESEGASTSIGEVVSNTINRVESWVKAHGVGLEMKVAGAFRKKMPPGYPFSSVDHGRAYIGFDPTSDREKVRETDVVVRLTKSTMGNVWITVWLIIECKSSKASPWVLYYDLAQPTGFRYDPFGSLWELKHLDNITPANIGGFSSSSFLSGNGISSCYSLETATDPDARGNQKNDARDAVRQVIGAAKGITEKAALDEHHAQVHVFIPVIITSAPICTITLGMDGEYSVKETKRGLFLGRLDSENATPGGVWIISESDLENFADEAFSAINGLDSRSF